MANDPRPETGDSLRHLRETELGWSVAEAMRQTKASRSTIVRAEERGVDPKKSPAGRQYLDRLRQVKAAGASPSGAVKDIIESRGETPSDMFREFAARMEQKPVDQQWVMAEAFAITLQMLYGAREGSPGGSKE